MVSCPSLTKQTSMAGFFLKDVSPVPFCFQPAHTPAASDKVSNEAFHNAFSRTKIRIGEFRGILRRFAKYSLTPFPLHSFSRERFNGRNATCSHPSPRQAYFLIPSDLLTRHSFWRRKLTSFYFHIPKI